MTHEDDTVVVTRRGIFGGVGDRNGLIGLVLMFITVCAYLLPMWVPGFMWINSMFGPTSLPFIPLYALALMCIVVAALDLRGRGPGLDRRTIRSVVGFGLLFALFLWLVYSPQGQGIASGMPMLANNWLVGSLFAGATGGVLISNRR